MVKVTVNEIIGLEHSFEGLMNPILDNNMRLGAVIAGAEVQKEARTLVPVDQGALRLSIASNVLPVTAGLLIEVGPTQPYGAEIEYGRPPGTYVSPAALAGWAARKGLNPFAVSWAIMKKGSPAQPFMGPAADAKEATVVAVMEQAVANAFTEAFALPV